MPFSHRSERRALTYTYLPRDTSIHTYIHTLHTSHHICRSIQGVERHDGQIEPLVIRIRDILRARPPALHTLATPTRGLIIRAAKKEENVTALADKYTHAHTHTIDDRP
jgi:hypothetical protein